MLIHTLEEWDGKKIGDFDPLFQNISATPILVWDDIFAADNDNRIDFLKTCKRISKTILPVGIIRFYIICYSFFLILNHEIPPYRLLQIFRMLVL